MLVINFIYVGDNFRKQFANCLLYYDNTSYA